METREFTQKDLELIQSSYAVLYEAARGRCTSPAELEVVRKAYDFASNAHNGVRRRSGEPFIIHPITVALIVVKDIGLGYKSIAAALLHDVVEDTDYTIDDIRDLFGDKIASLVDGLTKIKDVLGRDSDIDDKESLHVMNLKRILLTLNDDVRVVLIKLADRLHNCRTLDSLPAYKREKILSETMFIFIPLAHRLGLYGIKSEMEDIWLRNKDPQAYRMISSRINDSIELRRKEVEEFAGTIEKAIAAEGLSCTILRRVKSPYSIWNKMKNKGVSFEEIYDLYAVRVIFDPLPGSSIADERHQCFNIYSAITSIYPSKEDRFRDWIAHPKNNGYEALHCTLMSKSGIWVEVQIRSRRMNDIAEKGIAAHWNYKRNGVCAESEMEHWLERVKDILAQSENVNPAELLDIIHTDLIQSDIIVFTPKGDQVRIPKNATVLDFAFQIHTEIGLKAVAGKVNMKLVSLSTPLSSGDQVEIITAQNQTPQSEWLTFLQTRKARSTVSDFLRESPSPAAEPKQPRKVTLTVDISAPDDVKLMEIIEKIKNTSGVTDVARKD